MRIPLISKIGVPNMRKSSLPSVNTLDPAVEIGDKTLLEELKFYFIYCNNRYS